MWVFLTLLGCGLSAVSQELQVRRAEVYSVFYAELDTIKEAVQLMVGEGGSVVLEPKQRKLIVMATDAEHKQIEALLKELNAPPKNVFIQVEFLGSSREKQSEYSIGAKGRVVIREGGATSGKITIKPRVINELSEGSSRSMQSLLVMSGRTGEIFIGEEVPYAEWFLDYATLYGYLDETLTLKWHKVGASLLVEPRVIDNGLIHLKLTPQIKGLVDNNPYHTKFSQVATEITVRDGQTVNLGGLAKDNDFYRRFLIGVDQSGATHTLNIRLTPRIQDNLAAPVRR